jgi:hypothetical protein
LKEEGKPMLRDLFYFYNQGLLKILGFTLLIVFPWQVFLFGWIYYIFQTNSETPMIFAVFIYIFMFITTQRPFITLYRHVKMNEEYEFKEMIKDFISSFGVVAFSGSVLLVLSYFGMGLFIVPGLILVTFAFLLPFYKENGQSMKKMIANGMNFYQKNWFSIYTDLLLWISIDVLIWVIFLNGMSTFEINLLSYTLLRIVVNLFLFPFIYFYLAEKYEHDEWV